MRGVPIAVNDGVSRQNTGFRRSIGPFGSGLGVALLLVPALLIPVPGEILKCIVSDSAFTEHGRISRGPAPMIGTILAIVRNTFLAKVV